MVMTSIKIISMAINPHGTLARDSRTEAEFGLLVEELFTEEVCVGAEETLVLTEVPELVLLTVNVLLQP